MSWVYLPRVQTVVESVSIQAHGGSERLQVILGECTLVLTILVGEQVVMIFPEGILIAGTFSGFGCPLRFITQYDKIEIAKTNFPRINICCYDLTTRVSGKAPAEWSLIVAKFNDRDRGIGVALEVGGVTDEVVHQLLLVADRCQGGIC